MARRALLSALFCTLLLVAASSTRAQVLSNGSLSANESVALFREVQSTNVNLLGYIISGNISGADQFLDPSVQFVVANIAAPLTLPANDTVVANTFALVAPDPNTNVTFQEQIFFIIDENNTAYVDVFNTGKPNENYFLTSAWQKQNSTWRMKFTSIAPAFNGTVVTRTLPEIFVTSSNVTTNVTTSANATLPANFTQPAVGNATEKLQAALSNSSISLQNIAEEFFAPQFHLVVPGLYGPIPFNLTVPTFLTFFTLLRARNATAPPPTAVAYSQLGREAAILTVLVPEVPMIGNAYVVLLWQYLDKSANSTVNAAPGPRWLLVLASVNIAPSSQAL
ncbi:hypothetical protein KFL_004720070 [Klebsormidium nitens]|uniref:Uncharacterized protein n=1 Tax=Klebsormidium nitens TaxID=105231 RepID=A0A0U9HKK8_KLENI|nr:hypothetical protein KFL_004720070 [Klebsormidium nitens]|eukprot:GAQ88948.1 hypothetical protein KFL_004720070 [Klebsormidium nitens]